jgi:hypothetical protein
LGELALLSLCCFSQPFRGYNKEKEKMKRSLILKVYIFIGLLSVTACGSTQQPLAINMESIKCPEVRPEMCTMDYNPVCGSSSDGSSKTYSNGCNACSDPKVTSYSQGECK